MFVYEQWTCLMYFTELPSSYIFIIIIFILVEVARTSELFLCRKSARTLPASDPSEKHLVGVPWNITENWELCQCYYFLHTSSNRLPGLSLSAKVLRLPPEECCLQKPLKYQNYNKIFFIILIDRSYLQMDRGLGISQELEEVQDRKIHRRRRYPDIKTLYEDHCFF